ncbi:MAG: XRE family transcriptional regulator [Bacillota bacterium]
MLGERIKRKRTEQGKSLRDLAAATGLTPSFLSQIERDLVEPSITSLRKIAEALEVPIFYFLMTEQEVEPVVRKHERKVITLPGSGISVELLTPDLDKQMELIMIRLGPGKSTVQHPLPHSGEECTVVLEGKMRITVGSNEYVLDAGDSIYYFASVPHQLVNIGDDDLVILSAITPPTF